MSRVKFEFESSPFNRYISNFKGTLRKLQEKRSFSTNLKRFRNGVARYCNQLFAVITLTRAFYAMFFFRNSFIHTRTLVVHSRDRCSNI